MSASLEVVRARLRAALDGARPGLASADELCRACVGVLGVDGAAVSLVHGGAMQGTFGSSNDASRRLDEYQFTFGEGPCLDAVSTRRTVHAPDLDSPGERRWPVFSEAVLDDGIRGVFAVPIMLTTACVGALDLFRSDPGPLRGDDLAGAVLAAELASLPLLGLVAPDGDPGGEALEQQLLDLGDDGWGRLADMDRVEVHQATGMLVSQLDTGPAEALSRLRAHAVATGQTASEVAWAIVERRLVLERDRPTGEDGAGDDAAPGDPAAPGGAR